VEEKILLAIITLDEAEALISLFSDNSLLHM
jgi:hypothetical protein